MTRAIIAAAIAHVTANAAGHATLSDQAIRHYAQIVVNESERHDLDPYLLVVIIDSESSWDARSVNPDTNATGLMQLILSPEMLAGTKRKPMTDFTQFLMQVEEPAVNIFLGARWLRRLINKCGSVELALGKYNGQGCTRTGYGRIILRRAENLRTGEALEMTETREDAE